MAQIYRLLFLLFLLSRLLPAADAQFLLENIRRKVIEQLGRSANYACIESVDRTYYSDTRRGSASCEGVDEMLHEETMHDRLRLNVAVSKGGEIFSWLGENNISTSKVEKLVGSGPVSSGGFVGFLRNIFTVEGVKFTYRGRSKEDHAVSERFDYAVDQAISQYRIEGGANESAVVPFRGSFSADASTLQLNRLEIIAGKIPGRVKICSAHLGVHYQIATIAGSNTLIPSSFNLRIQDESRFLTVSRGQYNDCHEFRAQSTLRFDTPEIAKREFTQGQKEEWLPPGLTLRIALKTPIDSKTAYAGDAVEGILTAPVRDLSGETLLPQNSIVHGILTQLQAVYQPETYYYLRIQFNTASFGGRTYLMRAIHKPSGKETRTLSLLYKGAELPIDVTEPVKSGTMVIHASHLKLDDRFQGDWQTIASDKPSHTAK